MERVGEEGDEDEGGVGRGDEVGGWVGVVWEGVGGMGRVGMVEGCMGEMFVGELG